MSNAELQKCIAMDGGFPGANWLMELNRQAVDQMWATSSKILAEHAEAQADLARHRALSIEADRRVKELRAAHDAAKNAC